MGRTYRKDNSWEDESRKQRGYSHKKSKKSFSTSGMKVLNTYVEDEVDHTDFDQDEKQNHTSHTNHTT